MSQFVLPNPDYAPSKSLELLTNFPVTRPVAIQLPLPELPIGRRSSSVCRASVPETPIHKHRDAMLGEDEIWSTENCGTSSPPPNAVHPEDGDQSQFGGRILSAFHACHYCGALLAGENVGHACTARSV